jgi:hypothetical protein
MSKRYSVWLVVAMLSGGCGGKGPDPDSFIVEDDLPADVAAPQIDWTSLQRRYYGGPVPELSPDDEAKLTAHFGDPKSRTDKDDFGNQYGRTDVWERGGIEIRRGANDYVYEIKIGKRWSTNVAGARVGDRLSVTKQRERVTQKTVDLNGSPVPIDEFAVGGHEDWFLNVGPVLLWGSELTYENGSRRDRKQPHPTDPVITGIHYRNPYWTPNFTYQRP